MKGEELNNMVPKAITAAIKEKKKKLTGVVATHINESNDKDEAFGIYFINLGDYE